MKFLFGVLNLLTDPDAIVAARHCFFTSAVTNAAALLVLGAYQAIRLSVRSKRTRA